MTLSFGNPRAPQHVVEQPADRPMRIPARANDERAIALIAERGRAYCGDLAPLLGMNKGATSNLLKRLERWGLLTSEVLPSPVRAISARRYFRLATPASAAPTQQETPNGETATRTA